MTLHAIRQSTFVERDDALGERQEVSCALSWWMCAIPQFEILRTIIAAFSVLVMHVFVSFKRTLKEFFHDGAVFMSILAVSASDDNVAEAVNATAPDVSDAHLFALRSAPFRISPQRFHIGTVVAAFVHHAFAALRISPRGFKRFTDSTLDIWVRSHGVHFLSILRICPISSGCFAPAFLVVVHVNHSTPKQLTVVAGG